MSDLEVLTTALDVPAAEQDAFVLKACAGHEALLRKVFSRAWLFNEIKPAA